MKREKKCNKHLHYCTAIGNIAKKQGKTIYQIAKETNISLGSIYHWDTNAPSIDALVKVAKVLNVKVDAIIQEQELIDALDKK